MRMTRKELEREVQRLEEELGRMTELAEDTMEELRVIKGEYEGLKRFTGTEVFTIDLA